MDNKNIKDIPVERSSFSKFSDCIIIFLIYFVCMIIEWVESIRPHKQYIPDLSENLNFAYPMHDSTVPTPSMFAIIFLSWIAIVSINGIILYKYDDTFTLKSWLKFLYLVTRIVCFSFATTSLITDIIKKSVGSPRPYFDEAQQKYSNQDITQKDYDNAKQSFISGHASESWCLLLLLSLYLYHSYQYTMKCYFMNTNIEKYTNSNPHSYFLCNLWWLLKDVPLLSIGLIFMPCYIALWISLTRITDYKHTPSDIIAGSVIGGAIAYITYLIFYDEMYARFNFKDNKHDNCISIKDNMEKILVQDNKKSTNKIIPNESMEFTTKTINTTNKMKSGNNNNV